MIVDYLLNLLNIAVRDEYLNNKDDIAGCNAMHKGYVCCRAENHTGLHVATDGEKVCDVFDDSAATHTYGID